MRTRSAAISGSTSDRRALLSERYRATRETTERLCAGLSAEDQLLQSMPDCSPAKWHRAHTTWFFETFLLMPRGVSAYDSRWAYLFNSYYESLGPRHLRPMRGLLSRPSNEEIAVYRRWVDERVMALLTRLGAAEWAELEPVLELGIAHEEQHQELILTDILHAFSTHPFLPSYRAPVFQPRSSAPGALSFATYQGGLVELGASHDGGFHFDNEAPRHRVWVNPFQLARRLVSVAEWKAFRQAGGYTKPSLWLSEGFDWMRAHEITAPLYMSFRDGVLRCFGLEGEREIEDDEPLVHVSYYEADAIARFLGARLPSEAEWELAARDLPVQGNFLEQGSLRALPASAIGAGHEPEQLFGDAWEWTCSSYGPYPGFSPPPGALGEYNAKFMVNQMVLRGGSCFTPRAHMRASYRNFWPPHTRFQMSGIRLARDA